MIISFTKKFSAAHTYYQPNWDHERNKKEFGLCFSQFGHGHNYEWIADFQIPNTVVNTVEVQLALDELNESLEHHHLSLEENSPLKGKIPTTENIALFLFESLAQQQLPYPLIRIKLKENNGLWSEVELTKGI